MLVYITRLVRSFIAEVCEPIYCLIYGHDNDHIAWIRLMRGLCSFLTGVLLAYLMWMLVAFSSHFGKLYAAVVPEWVVLVVFLLFNGLAYLLSRSVRVVTLLIFVGLLGNAGRSYLRATAFALVISGPIDNLVRNAGEVARVFACTTILTYNLTKTRFDLMAKPFTNTLQTMKDDLDEIQGNFKELQIILEDLKYGVEYTDIEDDKFGNSKQRRAANATNKFSNNSSYPLPKASAMQAKFVRNMRNRCKHQLRSGHHVCREIFLKGYRKCATNFPDWLASVVCWPYRVDIICRVNIFGNPDKLCDASKVVPSSFGETYVNLLVAEHQLYDNSSNIEITYQIQNVTTSEQLLSAQETSEQFIKDFERRRRMFSFVMTIIEKFLYLFILGVICTSIRYHYKYCINVEFDNFYITDYFKHVDARRKLAQKPSILPLHSYERPMYVDVEELNSRTDNERRTDFFHLLQLSLELITAGIFILLDRLVVNLLRIIHKRSLITYQQEGEHEVRFRINGTGLMARLLRTTMKNFNIHERVSTSLSNEECLPTPHVLPRSFYIKLLLLYLVILLLVYVSTTFQRLRRVICSHFYYKREKWRILFLYSSILRCRHSYREVMRKRAEENMASRHVQGRLNICLVLRLSYPKRFGWLANYNCAKRSCLTCNAREDNRFVFCENCGMPYCRDCCRELKTLCVYCDELMHQEPAPELSPNAQIHRKRK
ncbi:protein sneaky isoform X1 [Drosophila virilis]|nr:protein sneaky isoform X1 [Drosophila virilis]